MATKATKTDDMQEPIPFFAFKDNDKYSDDITVGINGNMRRIQRGKTVLLPRHIYETLMSSQRQDVITANLIAQESENYDRISKILD